MNHTYRLIWSRRSHCFVAVGEHARNSGKSARSAALGIAAALAAAVSPLAPASAAPADGAIKQGTGSIAQPSPTSTLITQGSPRLAIDWKSFSSAATETIEFRQPDASSIVLNRVIGGGRSELMGGLSANGQVFVINPNGVLFGQGASVSVAGLVASTLDMKSEQFYAGSQILEKGGAGAGAVLNQGKLTATLSDTDPKGGYIALVGPSVANQGAITAQQGRVLMAAGDKVTLTLAGSSLAGYTIDRGSLSALVDNSASGMISAHGGQVTLDASAANALSRAVVNHNGVIEAQTLGTKRGAIQLLGGIRSGDREAGDLLVAGKLDVSAPASGDGGSVRTSAARVNIDERAQVILAAKGNAGTWENTSRDFLIAEGNGPATSSSIGAATLSTNLKSGPASYASPNIGTGTGDLYVNAAVEWNADNRLTLSASRNIYINAAIKADAPKGSLQLEFGQAGSSPAYGYFLDNGATVKLPNGDNFFMSSSKGVAAGAYRVITRLGDPKSATGNDLQGISNTVNQGRYVLGDDIDAAPTKDWNNKAGFVPISQFRGTLDGLGHKISNLYINNAGASSVGLFDVLTLAARVQNLTLENASVTKTGVSDGTGIGALAGTNSGEIFNVHATMSVTSFSNNAGGLVGINNGQIRSSSAVGVVASEEIKDAEATGGLVGRLTPGSRISDSYAMVNVSGNGSVGGLVGLMEKSLEQGKTNPIVTGSFAAESAGADKKGAVRGKNFVGGLVGFVEGGIVSDSYAAVPVTGDAAIGGLVGFLDGSVQRSYANGPVVSNANSGNAGGLVGNGDGSAFNSFWNTDTTGQTSSRGGGFVKGITTADMASLSTFALSDWKIDAEGGTGTIWRIYEGRTAPLLRSFLVTKDVEARSVTYNAETQFGCTGTPCGSAPGSLPFTPASGRDAGTYAPYSAQQGYDIRGGTLTITPFLLTPTAIVPERTYDGTRDVLQPQQPPPPLAIQAIGGDKVTANYASAQYDDKNAGDNKKVTFSGITLNDNSLGNYEIASTLSVGAGKITPLTLSLSGTEVASRVYDGSMVATVSKAGTLEKAIQGDVVSVSAGAAAFENKNVGQNKTVTVSGLTLAGEDAGNYLLDKTTATAKADITPLTVSVSGTEVAGKVYDGSMVATVSKAGTLEKAIQGDVVSVSAGAAAFENKNVGQNKTVAVSGLTLAGEDAGNYLLDKTTATAKADITPLMLSLSGTEVAGKVYDGDTVATVSKAGTLEKAIQGDVVSVSAGAAAFENKNVGQNKTVTVSGLTLAGEDAGNYLLDKTTATATADITPLMLSLSGMEVAGKTYDGSTVATVSRAGTLANGIANDVVTLNATGASASFADKNVGTDKAVTVSGLALEGADAGNYRIANPSAKASIAARALSLSGTEIADKVYDGSTVARILNAGTLDKRVDGDDVTASAEGATAAFADKNAGISKLVTVSRVALTGADAANYVLDSTQIATAAATIRPRPLAVRAQGLDRTYDGTINATVTLGDNRIEGDKFDLRYAKASFADGNAGSGKTVTVAGIAASGADAGNYVADANVVTTASVSKAPLTITANPDDKAFDGKAYRGGNGVTYDGFVPGENAAALSGQPGYGGTAQGAVSMGSYTIAPAGYASQNYAIVYVDGKLTIRQPPVEPVYQAAGTVLAATAAAMSEAATTPDSMRLLSQQPALQVAGCGARLPAQPLAVVVDCNEGRASTAGNAVPPAGF